MLTTKNSRPAEKPALRQTRPALARAARLASLATIALLGATAQAKPVSIFDPSFQFTCPPEQQSTCKTPLLRTGDDCRVDLLTNGHESLRRRLATLARAKKSIRIQALVFAGDESGQIIAHKLVDMKKANPNLKIQIIVDALSNLFPGTDPAAIKLAGQTQEMYNYLEANGIELKGDPRQLGDDAMSSGNLAVLNKRFHDKMWIIDGEDPVNGVAITGGMNIANDYFRLGPGAKHTWRDQDTMERGGIVTDIMNAFDDNFDYFNELEVTRPSCFVSPKVMGPWYKWVNFYHRHIAEHFVPSDSKIVDAVHRLEDEGLRAAEDLDGSDCRFIQSRPRLNEKYIMSAYLNMIKTADKEIRIANAYFIPTPEIVAALKDAVRHGKKVKILTNSFETNDLNQMTYASRAMYKTLLEANSDPEAVRNGGKLSIFEWQGHRPAENQTDGTIHAKFMVTDHDASIVGSYNLDPRSQNLNSETVLASRSRRKADALVRRFDNEDLPRAKEISWDQAVEWNDPTKLKDGINLELSERFKGQF